MPDSSTPPHYPFDEFWKNVEDVHAIEYFERRHESGQNEPSFERSVIEVSEYMKTLYLNERERQYKLGRFILIMGWISENIHNLDTGNFAVFGSAKVGSLVGEHVFRAVHQIFTTCELSKLGHGPSPDEVMKLARKLGDASRG